MINGPVNNLHAEWDICKPKAGKIFSHSCDPNRNPDAATRRMCLGGRDHAGMAVIDKNG